MATTVQPVSTETTKQLVNYRTDGGVAVIEMCDPPANTYTYEMNRQLDDAILKAVTGGEEIVLVLDRASGNSTTAIDADVKPGPAINWCRHYRCPVDRRTQISRHRGNCHQHRET